MNVKDIEIKKIKQLENIRLRVDEKDVHTLMTSIKQDGLLEPIGVATTKGSKDEYIVVYGNRRLEACRKLGWNTIPAILNATIPLKDFVIKNTLENVERKQISEAELGRIFVMLKTNHKMTNSEIQSRFGIPLNRVERTIAINLYIPDEYREKIRYNIMGKKGGFISAGSANTILSFRRRYGLTKKNIADLLEASRQDKFNHTHLEIISSLLIRNYSVEEAIKSAKKYTVISTRIPVLTKEIMEMKDKYKKPFHRIVSEILAGKLKDTLNIPEWK